MNLLLFLSVILCACSEPAEAQRIDTPIDQETPGVGEDTSDDVELPAGKSIYKPKEFRDMDWQDPESKWSYHRMAYTDNFVVFWEKGFGDDLASPPPLEGQSMKVDLPNLLEKLETFYSYYRDELQFVKPGSKSERYRMMVMISYSLEGTAYGGDYDKVIGAMWVTPSRLGDKKLNCVAHELGHSFQLQILCDRQGDAWGGGGIYEMTSQWMLWQVNPEWITDEKYHWDAFMTLTHKAFLHQENIYHSPFVLEYWGMKRGLPVMAELFRQGKVGEDPVMTYKRMFELDQEQFCDEMFDACRHFINWDFERVWEETRPYANKNTCKLVEEEAGWYRIAAENCPENYGYNGIPLTVPQPGETVKVTLEGDLDAAGYNVLHAEEAGWRYGFVGVTQSGKSIYGDMGKTDKGTVSFTALADEKLAYLWLVVMGAPTEHRMNPTSGKDDPQWPYRITFEGTAPVK